MSGYKDKTFCRFFDKCKEGSDCGNALTETILSGYIKWRGDNKNMGMSVFMDKPDCFVPLLIEQPVEQNDIIRSYKKKKGTLK